MAWWGSYITDFNGVQLAGEQDRPRNIIVDVSGLFRSELGRVDSLLVRRRVGYMANAALNMLVLETLLDINSGGAYARVPVLMTGRYLYYEYCTGHADGFPATDTLQAVTPRFRVAM